MRSRLLLIVPLLALTLSACGSRPTATPTRRAVPPTVKANTAQVTPSVQGNTTSIAEVSSPPSNPTATPQPTTAEQGAALTVACQDLLQPQAELLKTEGTVSEAPLQVSQDSVGFNGCQITTEGTRVQFPDLASLTKDLETLLTQQGWTLDTVFTANEATGTTRGYTKEGKLAYLRTEWRPAPEATCPTEQPISACQLPPEQQIVTIRLNIAPVPTDAPSTEEEDIKQTIYTYVMENTETRKFDIQIDKIDGDFARALVTPQESDTGLAYAFVHKTGSNTWTVIGVDTTFDSSFYSQNNIPQSLQLPNP